jgi:ATP-dependent Lhr-like helicase
MPRKAQTQDLDKIPSTLFKLTPEEIDKAFEDFLKSRFPFSYKMKFIAERFGALPRGRTMGTDALAQLPRRFQKTPIYDETIREAMTEKVDISSVKKIMKNVEEEKIKVSTLLRIENPTPLAYPIFAKYSEVPELMAPERVLLSNVERVRRTILARKTSLLCLSCGNLTAEKHVREFPENPTCDKCGERLLASLYPYQDSNQILSILKRRKAGEKLAAEELDQLAHARRTADLILSYGKKALIALQVKGVGPETAFRILGKMHPSEEDFYMDLLKAKIQYLKTRPYWENKGLKTQGKG